MKTLLVVFLILFIASITSAQAQPAPSDSRFPLFNTAEAAQHHCPFDTIVWLDTASDTYTLGTLPKGATKNTGAYMCQREADQMDYHMVPKAQ